MLTNWNVAALLLTVVLTQTTVVPGKTTTDHSEPLHFDYTYDSALVTMGDVAQDALKSATDESTGVKKAAVACVTLPVTAVDSANGLRMAMIMRMDSKCLGIEIKPEQVSDLAKSSLSEAMHRMGGEPTMGEPNTYELGGHKAAAISATVDSDKYKTTFYGMASCSIQGSDSVCWEFVTTDCSKLAAMIAAPVKFEGKEPQAVIPAAFAIACRASK